MGNMDNVGQPMPNQQAGYQQPPQQQYAYQPGPSLNSITSNPMGKLGLILIILAVIGLIISFAVPWGYVEADGLDEKSFGHNLENEDEASLCYILVGLSSEDAVDDYGDHLTGTPGMADMGFIFIIIIGAIMIVFGMMKNSPSIQKWANPIQSTIGIIALIPSVWILLAGMRFIGYHVFFAMNGKMYEDMIDSIVFPAAYIILIFGLIIFLMIFKMVKGNTSFKGGVM